jgi:hypothetical protein
MNMMTILDVVHKYGGSQYRKICNILDREKILA